MNPIAKKKIKGHLLKELGYVLTEKIISFGTHPDRYGIFEVREEGKGKREVGFCFLYSIRHEAGVILPHPFSFYQLHKIRNFETFLIEHGLD